MQLMQLMQHDPAASTSQSGSNHGIILMAESSKSPLLQDHVTSVI
jgi:hypothetical protein